MKEMFQQDNNLKYAAEMSPHWNPTKDIWRNLKWTLKQQNPSAQSS